MNFFIKIWNACYYFIQGVWNTMVTGSADGKGKGGLNGTGFGKLLFIGIVAVIIAAIVALIVLGVIRKRKKKAKKAEMQKAQEQPAIAEEKPVVAEKVAAEPKQEVKEAPVQPAVVVATNVAVAPEEKPVVEEKKAAIAE